eukprot:Gb_29044 [translate_table: standard]
MGLGVWGMIHQWMVLKKIKQEKYQEALEPVACLLSEQLLESYILGIVGFRQKIDVNSLKMSLKASLGEHQRFSSVVIKDKRNNLKWCLTDQVDMNDHVIVPCLSPEFIQNPNFVNEYTASLATAPPLNPSRPLWEVHVLNATSGQAGATLVFRIHHCVGDCVSMMSLILNSTRKVSDPKSVANIVQHGAKDRQVLSYAQTLYNWMAALWFTILIALQYLATFLWKEDCNSLRRVSKTKVSQKRLAHVTINLDDICLVRKVVNGTVNDVMTGVLSAGLVRYLCRRNAKKTTNAGYERRRITENADRLPSNTRVRAVVIVNTRGSPVLQDLESKMQNPTQAKWGNRLGFWLFPLPVVNYENPLEYCRAAAITSRRKKLSFEGSLSFAAVKYMAQIGAIKVIAYISNRVNSKATLLFSNIMGPVEEIQYGDNPVTHIIPTALINNTPIVIHFVSYAGKGKLVALVSEDVVPDPEQLCLDCADALQQMKEAALWHPENSYP